MEVMVRLRDLNTRQEKNIEFPADIEDVKYQFGLDDDDYDKAEFIVVDSNTDMIVEYDSIYGSIEVISAFAEMVEDVDDDVVKAVHEVTGYEACDFVDYDFDFSDCSLLPDVTSKSELGQYWVDELGIQNIPKDQLEMYFDYEAYGRDIDLENQGGFSSYGYIDIPN